MVAAKAACANCVIPSGSEESRVQHTNVLLSRDASFVGMTRLDDAAWGCRVGSGESFGPGQGALTLGAGAVEIAAGVHHQAAHLPRKGDWRGKRPAPDML